MFAIPWQVVVALLAIPFAVAALFGSRVFATIAPLAFRCTRCDREFRRQPHRRFPRSCPHCGAHDWSRR
ncbi:MAG TPA: hypothetical protein VGG74_09100 [Kofleriaceae bacterium]|jgi:Zn finger protein HypA/HybF involved in hydrogenase expression